MSHLSLDKQLCFKLYSVNKTLTKLYSPLLKKLELTYPQYLVMLVLWENNKSIAIKTLGETLDLDSGTLSPLLKRMQTNDLVARNRCDKDERTVLISLTAKGLELKDKAEHIPMTLFSLTGLNKEEMLALQDTLSELLATTQQHI